ncbi:MAG: hypothetical protein BGO98_19720 [Myxococcales bacterium 68-20]|nr:MAG: hypothetical protein BGO98_19720 [Myxococcales bacterium 68-20]
MKVVWSRHVFALSVLASVPFIACAASEVRLGSEDAVAPPPGSQVPSVPTPPDAGTPDADAAPAPERSRCSEGGFCLEPLPLQRPLLAVSAASMNDAWAVARDAILRWDGTSWKDVYHYVGIGSAAPELFGIWATKHDDVWALATGALVRYSARDGGAPAFREYRTSFRASAADTATYWVNPASDELWVVNGYRTAPTVYRYRETPEGALEETRITDPAIGFPWVQSNGTFLVRSIFGFASDDIYVGGAWCTRSCNSSFPEFGSFDGALAHYDGTSWSIVTRLKRGETVSGIYGTKAVGGAQRLWLWVGLDAFSSIGNELRLLSLPAEDGGAATVVAQERVRLGFAVGHPLFDSWNAGCHHIIGSPAPSGGAWMSDVCSVYRWNGTSLETKSTVVNGVPLGTINGIWAGDDEEAWIVGEAPRQFQSEIPAGFAARRVRKAP